MRHSPLYGKPRLLQKTSDHIAEGLDAIRRGTSNGKYPGLDKIIGPKKEEYSHLAEYGYFGEIGAGGHVQNLIQDVYPTPLERVAVVEHVANETKDNLEKHIKQYHEDIKEAISIYATKEELKVVNDHTDRLDSQSTAKTMILLLTIIGLLISMAYNGINIYKNIHL